MKRSYDDYYNEPRRRKVKQKTVGGAFLKVFLLFLLSVFCILVSIVAGVGIGFVVSTPQISVEDVKPSEYPSRILDRDGNVMIELTTAGSNRQEATSDEIPEMLKNAVVAIEDERFYEHNGIVYEYGWSSID